MTFYFLTLFPQTIEAFTKESILKRARDSKKAIFKTINLRDFAENKHKTVDDRPYGGGKGMVMKVDILKKALDSISQKPYVILLSASGKKYTQEEAKKLTKKKGIALICGHYEGTDARIEKYTDAIFSTGDFIATGGEIGALAIADSVTRLIPGVIHKESTEKESFSRWAIANGNKVLLEHPQFTRPEVFEGQKVPKVLLDGNHQKINAWRLKEALKRTKKYRPDLLKEN